MATAFEDILHQPMALFKISAQGFTLATLTGSAATPLAQQDPLTKQVLA
jgi:hypothetical protein